MMTKQIRKCVAAALVAACACVACAQSLVREVANIADAYTDQSREKREQAAAPARIKEIFALAKKSAEDDFNINFSGFFAGMSRHDANALAEYYELKNGEYSIDATPGKAVSKLWFSLTGVRRITRGGNTLDELAQAVANRVGDLKRDFDSREWGHKTIDGIVVTFGGKGLSIQNVQVASQTPLATAEAVRKDKADLDAAEKAAAEEAARKAREEAARMAREAARKAREAAEEAARKESAAKEALLRLIGDMIAIPGGNYKCTATRKARSRGDMIAIPRRNYKMGKYEVTQMQWYAIMGDDPSEFKGDDNPVECVSWEDCQKFLEKLNARPEVKASGLTFRLPTEKEWEYACRAGSTGDYCNLADGTEITRSTLGEVAWYRGNSGNKTHPVGQKKPNAFGLYDMLGNVQEWCEDYWYAAGDSDRRVHRGGSWGDVYGGCWAGIRYSYCPGDRYNHLGFRLAASQDVNR